MSRLTAAVALLCGLVLTGCTSEPRKIKLGETIKPGETVVIDLSELSEQTKEKRLKECTEEISDCRLHELFNIADKAFKEATGEDASERPKQIDELIKMGYLLQFGDGKWKLHKPLYEFLIEVERRKADVIRERLGCPDPNKDGAND